MMIPEEVTLIPQYIIYSKLGWINTYLPLTVPSFFAGSAFYIFLLRQFFMTIPRELDDAARVDGASYFEIYWRIILPLSTPALITIGIFTFQNSWNAFFGPLIFLQDRSLYTVSLGLSLFQEQYYTNWTLLMAASVAIMLPTLVVFFLLQRRFIEGVTFTGLKG
jgi:ABC-type glycerol-3-phosphate transport system permease component